jgi:proteasome lid subunit RPN8/RPN11
MLQTLLYLHIFNREDAHTVVLPAPQPLSIDHFYQLYPVSSIKTQVTIFLGQVVKAGNAVGADESVVGWLHQHTPH